MKKWMLLFLIGIMLFYASIVGGSSSVSTHTQEPAIVDVFAQLVNVTWGFTAYDPSILRIDGQVEIWNPNTSLNEDYSSDFMFITEPILDSNLSYSIEHVKYALGYLGVPSGLTLIHAVSFSRITFTNPDLNGVVPFGQYHLDLEGSIGSQETSLNIQTYNAMLIANSSFTGVIYDIIPHDWGSSNWGSSTFTQQVGDTHAFIAVTASLFTIGVFSHRRKKREKL